MKTYSGLCRKQEEQKAEDDGADEATQPEFPRLAFQGTGLEVGHRCLAK
jgi:hypothetical protein